MNVNRQSQALMNATQLFLILSGASSWEPRSTAVIYELGAQALTDLQFAYDADRRRKLIRLAVSRGWLEAVKLSERRVGYRLTSEGETALDELYNFNEARKSLSRLELNFDADSLRGAA